MYLSDLLDLHKSYAHEHSRPEILGDAYLMQTNPVYRNVRLFSLDIGCTYIEAYPEYLLLPFHELQRIVATKRIPYVPSGRLLEGIESQRPNVFTAEEVTIPESYHLHESAHVIAEHFFKDVVLNSSEEKILKAILSESFANTVDALSCVPATNDIHRFFIGKNCYMQPRKNVMQAMARLTADLGATFNFMLTFFTYVQANFLAKPLSKKSVQQLADQYAAGHTIGAKQRKDVQIVCDIGERLDPNFRTTTTGAFLKQEGFEGEVFDLLDFPFSDVFAKNAGFKKACEGLSKVLA